MNFRKTLLAVLVGTIGFVISLTYDVSCGGEKYDFIEPENNSIQIILIPSKDTITANEVLSVRVMILNTGGRNLILADIWEDDSENVVFDWTDEKGKKVKFLRAKNAPSSWLLAANPWASSLILGPDQFWGFTRVFSGETFPDSGNYYFQVTYKGTSPEFIQELIEGRFIKRSRILAPFDKYWNGEVKSNKIKVVVKK